MKGTICRIDDRQLKLGSVCRLKKLGLAPISGLRALLLCSWLLHYTGFQPLPPSTRSTRPVASYYPKKQGRDSNAARTD